MQFEIRFLSGLSSVPTVEKPSKENYSKGSGISQDRDRKRYELSLISAKSKVAARAKTIIAKHFDVSIKDKEDEIQKINSAIIEAQTSLHLLRYGAVSKTYAAYKASATSSVSETVL